MEPVSGSGQGSATGSLSSLDVSRIGGSVGQVLVDKSVFMIFEYGEFI